MKKRLWAGALFVAVPLLVHAFVSSLAVGEHAPLSTGIYVKVLLASGSAGQPVAFSVDGAFRVFEGAEPHSYGDKGFRYYGYRLGRAKASVGDDGMIAINDTPLASDSLCLVAEKAGAIRVGKVRFSGSLLIQKKSNGGIRLVNLIDIEEYIAGVLFREMPSAFPREALKAQAVAARSYALSMLGQGEGILRADERSQVYGGHSATRSKSREIVAETAGEVLVHEGRIIPAYYSSTCGGMTVKADDIFPFSSPPPLNRNTTCGACSASPHYRWSATFSYKDIVSRFNLGKNCRKPEVGIIAVDTARRAQEIALMDRKGTVLRRLEADKFRSILNSGLPLRRRMKSTRIDRIVHGKDSVTIEGGGYGHGVGLCQYGARGLAKQGQDYRQILGFYYRNSEVKTLAEMNMSDMSDMSGPAGQ